MFISTSRIVEQLISLVGSTQVASYGVERLQQARPSARVRLEGLTPFIQGEMSKTFTITHVGNLYSNGRDIDEVRVRFATSEVNLTNGSAVVDETFFFLDGEAQEYGYSHQSDIIASPAAANWFRFDYDFTGNPIGHVEVANIILAERVTVQFAYMNPVVSDTSRGGSDVALAAGGIDTVPGVWKGDRGFMMTLTDAEYYATIEPLLRERNNSGTVLVDLETEAGDGFPMADLRYGRFRVGAIGSLLEGGFKTLVGRVVEP